MENSFPNLDSTACGIVVLAVLGAGWCSNCFSSSSSAIFCIWSSEKKFSILCVTECIGVIVFFSVDVYSSALSVSS